MKFIGDFIIDLLDAGIDEDLETVNAGGVGNVDRGIFDGGAVLCRLGDSVHLSVDCAEAVLLDIPIWGFGLVDKTPHICAMRHARGRTVVTRGQDIFVAHDYGADLGSVTG